jgi:hypothetical protein
MNPLSARPASSDDDGHALPPRRCALPPVGTVEWERAGGPPLSFGQRLSVLGGAAGVLLMDLRSRLWWLLSQWKLLSYRKPARVDLAA